MRIATLALTTALALAITGCGESDDEPAAETSESAEETPTESAATTESETPETETPSESTAADDSGPIVLEDGRIDLCSAISIDDLAAATGWTPVSSGVYIGDGSCEWEFSEADLSASYDEYQTFDQVREQSQNFEVIELDGVADGAFLQLVAGGIKVTPESAGMVLGSGEWVVVGGAIESEESVTVDELAAAAEALARACDEVL